MDKLIDNALKRNPEALEEALSKVSHRDAAIINGVIWPISLVILISSFIKSLFK